MATRLKLLVIMLLVVGAMISFRAVKIRSVVIFNEVGVPGGMVDRLSKDACDRSYARSSMKAIDWVKKIIFLDDARPSLRFSVGEDIDAKYKVIVFGYKKGQWEDLDYNENGEYTGRKNTKRTH